MYKITWGKHGCCVYLGVKFETTLLGAVLFWLFWVKTRVLVFLVILMILGILSILGILGILGISDGNIRV